MTEAAFNRKDFDWSIFTPIKEGAFARATHLMFIEKTIWELETYINLTVANTDEVEVENKATIEMMKDQLTKLRQQYESASGEL